MKNDEKEILFLENQIPNLAITATKEAYLRTLASGGSVLISKNGRLSEIFPDGKVKFVKNILPPLKLKKGQIIKIR